MDLNLAEQTAVVIGGASGIGRAIGEAFAQERAQVALIDVASSVQQAADELAGRFGVPVLGLAADATDYAAMQTAERQVAGELGACRHLVYAAGLGSGKFGFPFWNLEPADWDCVLKVNLVGAVNAAHAFAPAMVASRKGTLLFLSSVAAQIGSQTDPPYSAAKAALINFAQCAARDLAPHNVRVNTICPGMVQTPLNRSVWQAWFNQQPEQARMSYEEWTAEKIRKVTPLGRWQEPEDVAALAVFLASEQAKNITGQTINVDGGQVMHW